MISPKYILTEICILTGVATSCMKDNNITVENIPLPTILTARVDSIETLGIDFTSYNRDFTEQCIEDFKFIPLETTEESLIATISSMALINDTIVVVDAGKAQKIFIFDIDGKFIRTVGARGEGPEEYGSINNVSFENDNISIHDWTRARILTYSLSGELVALQSLHNSRPHNVAIINDTVLAGSFASYFNEHPYAIEWIGRNDSTIETARPFRYKRACPAGRFVKTHNGRLLYYRNDSDTIFEVMAHSLTPAYTLGSPIDYDALMTTTGHLDDRDFNMALFENDDMPVNHYEIIEIGDLWLVPIQKGTKSYYVLFDTITHKSRTYLRSDLSNKECLIPFIPYKGNDRCILTNINHTFIELISENDRNRLYESIGDPVFKSTIENYDFDINNPIVCIIGIAKS